MSRNGNDDRSVLDERDHAIIREYLKTSVKNSSYKKYHPETNRPDVQAKKFFDRPEVRHEIRRLRARMQSKNSLTVNSVLKKLEDSYHAATADGQHGPAVRAAELLGKHIQMFTDKIEMNATINGLEGGATIESLKRDIAHLMKILNMKEKTEENEQPEGT